MTKATTDNSKSGKRKGTRSVSSLTPSQLARKRANDREAQRAIRARTKEHIDSLERELEELRSTQSRDATVQGLMKRNRILEAELHRLKESMGIPNAGPNSAYQHSYNSPSSRASSYAPGDIASYEGISAPGDPWTPAVTCSIASTVSSPSSSGADDFGSAYFPTSAPSSMADRAGYASSVNSPTMSCVTAKMGYEELEPDMSCPPTYQQSLPWNVYPVYYQASATL